jgi:hypothetical protein
MARRKEKLPLEALLRRWREEEEARRDAERGRADAAMIRRCCERYRFWFPGMYVGPADTRGPLARAFGALVGRVFGVWG